MTRPRLLRTNAPFRRLFVARAVSFTGDGAALVALLLHVKATHDSGPAVAGLLLAMSLPRALGPLAGALADRVDRRLVMVTCDAGQAALFGLVALTLPPYPALLALVAATSVLTTAFGPAGRSALPGLVGDEELPAANALLGTAFNLQTAAGPLLGGALVSWLGVRGAFGANAATFVVSAVLLTGLPRARKGPAPAERFLADARAGLRFARRHAVARAVALTLLLGVSFGALDNVALVFLARDELGAGALGFGALNSAYGIGMIVASLGLLRAGRAISPRRLFLAGWALTGAGTLATGFAPILATAIAVQMLAGGGNGLDNIASDTLIQRSVPGEMLGRVFGLTSTAAFLASGVAYAAGGPLLEVLSPRTIFVIAGAGVLGVAALARAMLPNTPAAGTSGAAAV